MKGVPVLMYHATEDSDRQGRFKEPGHRARASRPAGQVVVNLPERERPLKLLWIVEKFPPSVGGVQKYSYNTVLNMSPHSTVVLCDDDGMYDRGHVDNPLLEKGQTIYRMPVFYKHDSPLRIIGSLFGHVCFCTAVHTLVKKHDINMVLFGNACFSNLFVLGLLKVITRCPIGAVFHGEDIPSIYFKSNGLLRFLISRADLTVCNTHTTQKNLSGFMRRSIPGIIAYPGVEERFFDEVDASNYREKLGLQHSKIIYTVGRLDERKGHDTVIGIMPDLLKLFPDIVYLIAGVGPEHERLSRLTEKLGLAGHVRFLGKVPDEDIVALNRAGDVFVMPNRILADGDHEGFGIVFLEASACGKPVIGGRSGGAPEAVVDGQTGFLVDPLNGGELMEKIAYLLDNPEVAGSMGQAGRERAAQYFKWDKLAGELELQLRQAVKMRHLKIRQKPQLS